MKLVTVGLVALGLVAAGSAAVLVASMQDPAGDEGGPARETTIVVAARDLQAMAVVGQEDLVTRTLQASLAPAGSFADPIEVIGKVLTAPVQSGQALTSDAFVSDGSALRLAAALPPGQRAVSISLRDSLSDESMLYPGCMVDVLATMRIGGSDGAQQPVTLTLLQGITVLAIGQRSIVSPADEGTGRLDSSPSSGERPSVALLVDTHQAERLKLAMEEGSVSLVLRNPHDTEHPAAGGTDLAGMALGGGASQPAATSLGHSLQRTWETVVLRGSQRESHVFDLPPASHP